MSFSWNYFTRRFVLQNYRDHVAVGMICMFFLSKAQEKWSVDNDNAWTQQRVYTNDETDIRYKERGNKTDGAVKREKMLEFRRRILEARAQREREAMLDAYNHLNGRHHQLD
eukprot:403376095